MQVHGQIQSPPTHTHTLTRGDTLWSKEWSSYQPTDDGQIAYTSQRLESLGQNMSRTIMILRLSVFDRTWVHSSSWTAG